MQRDAPVTISATTVALEVTAKRGNAALDVAFSFGSGITVLVGPSGAGKSTLLDVVAGLFRPTRGSVRVGAQTWLDTEAGIDLATEERAVGVVLQAPALFPHLTVAENVAFGLSGHGSKDERRAKARTFLDRFRVDALAERRPAQLSGGEAQRVAIARAFAREPRVLLLDEPFSALDPELRDALAIEILASVRARSVPTLVVTHDRADARRLEGRVVRLENGRVVEESKARVDSSASRG